MRLLIITVFLSIHIYTYILHRQALEPGRMLLDTFLIVVSFMLSTLLTVLFTPRSNFNKKLFGKLLRYRVKRVYGTAEEIEKVVYQGKGDNAFEDSDEEGGSKMNKIKRKEIFGKNLITGLTLSEIAKNVDAEVIRGDKHCCHSLRSKIDGWLCTYNGTMYPQCFQIKKNDIYDTPQSNCIITLNKEIICSKDLNCNYLSATLQSTVNYLVFIILAYLFFVRLFKYLSMFYNSPSSTTTLTITTEKGDVITKTKYTYLSKFRIFLFLLLSCSLIAALYTFKPNLIFSAKAKSINLCSDIQKIGILRTPIYFKNNNHKLEVVYSKGDIDNNNFILTDLSNLDDVVFETKQASCSADRDCYLYSKFFESTFTKKHIKKIEKKGVFHLHLTDNCVISIDEGDVGETILSDASYSIKDKNIDDKDNINTINLIGNSGKLDTLNQLIHKTETQTDMQQVGSNLKPMTDSNPNKPKERNIEEWEMNDLTQNLQDHLVTVVNNQSFFRITNRFNIPLICKKMIDYKNFNTIENHQLISRLKNKNYNRILIDSFCYYLTGHYEFIGLKSEVGKRYGDVDKHIYRCKPDMFIDPYCRHRYSLKHSHRKCKFTHGGIYKGSPKNQDEYLGCKSLVNEGAGDFYYSKRNDSVTLDSDWIGSFYLYNEQSDKYRGGVAFLTQLVDCESNCGNIKNPSDKHAACCKGFKLSYSCPSSYYYLGSPETFWKVADCKKLVKNQPYTFLNPDEVLQGTESVKLNMVNEYNPKIPTSFTLCNCNGCKRYLHKICITVTSVSIILSGKSQDNIQPTGIPKYFAYHHIVKFSVNDFDIKNLTEIMFSDSISFNYFDNNKGDCDPADSQLKVCRRDKWSGESSYCSGCGLNGNIMEYKIRKLEKRKTLWQDTPQGEGVIKYKMYQLTPGSIGCDITLTDNFKESEAYKNNYYCKGECDIILDIYYAIKAYGPSVFEVKLLGQLVDTVSMRSGVCSDHNSFMINNICYSLSPYHGNSGKNIIGYPYINNYHSYLMSDLAEGPSNYFTYMMVQPKCCSSSYLPTLHISDLLPFMTVEGECKESVYKNSTHNMYYCGKLPAYQSLLQYTPISVVKESKDFDCKMLNNELVCSAGSLNELIHCKDNQGVLNCSRHVTQKYQWVINETGISTIITDSDSYMLGFLNDLQDPLNEVSENTSYSKIIKVLIPKEYYEMNHRDPLTTNIVTLVSYIGIFGFIITIFALLFSFVNSYNLGLLARKVNFTYFLKGRLNILTCKYCGLKMYTKEDIISHNLCTYNSCPYCIKRKNNVLYYEEFANRRTFKKHMSIHRLIRINKLLALMFIFNCYPLSSVIKHVEANDVHFEHDTGLRSAYLGTNRTIDSRFFNCDKLTCKSSGLFKVKMPLLDGAQFSLNTEKEGLFYSNTWTIKNPRISYSCTYIYSSSQVIKGPVIEDFYCACDANCNSYNYLITPMCSDGPCLIYNSKSQTNDFYCPKGYVCRHKIADSYIGCWCSPEKNTGIYASYMTCMPDMSKEIIAVFSCTYNGIKHKIIDLNGKEKIMDANQVNIQGPNIILDYNVEIKKEFNIGALIRKGSTIPTMLFYDLPNRDQATSSNILPYTLYNLPNDNSCPPGIIYNKASCTYSKTDCQKPITYCSCYNPDLTPNVISQFYPPLNRKLPCNYADTRISWKEIKLDREPTYCNRKQKNEPINTQIPELNLELEMCKVGEVEMTIFQQDNVELHIITAKKMPTTITCEGEYNRNNYAKFSFVTDEYGGLVVINCNSESVKDCSFTLTSGSSCNTTVLLPSKYNCKYNDLDIIIDCTNLQISIPDQPSGKDITDDSGSTNYSTWKWSLFNWISSFSFLGSKLFVTISIFIAILIILYTINLYRSIHLDRLMYKKIS